MRNAALVKYVPGWVPGAGFKAIAKRMKEDLDRLYSVPYTFVKNEMVIALSISG